MIRHRLVRAALAFLVSFAAGAAVLPGPLQALAPRWNGLEEIAPGVFLDDPSRAAEIRAQLADAEAAVRETLDAPLPRARMILCATETCAARFMGKHRPSGRTYGAHLVLVGPNGLNPVVLTHELAHVALHARMSLGDVVSPRFPTWFDEGLASWVARDHRLTPPDAKARARVLQAEHFTDWGEVMDDLGWRRGYGAALALVEEMVAAGGAAGLRGLIERVADGADFETERRRLLKGGPSG